VVSQVNARWVRATMRLSTLLVRPDDQRLVAEGAPFYYCVGRFRGPHGSTPGSQLWFRRLVPVGISDEDLLTQGSELSERIGWVT
jgi:hypothetical protein